MMHRRQRRGFSLLEASVAISIVLVMSIMVVQSIFNAMEMRDLLTERDETTRAARITMGKLRTEIQLAHLTTHQSNERYRTVFVGENGNPDVLTFATLAHQRLYQNSRECDQAEITIWAESSSKGRGYTLYHRESNRIDWEPDEGGVIQPLAHNVRSFNFRYLNHVTNEWVEEWSTEDADTSNTLPRAVEISMVLIGVDPDDKDRTIDIPFLTTIPLQYAKPVRRKAL